MTTYTIELPDRCPKCERNITSLAKEGGHYAQLIVCGVDMGITDAPPHRCPLVLVAGTERETVTVFGVVCKDCFDKEGKRLLKAYEAGAALLGMAKAIVKESK